MTEHDHLGWLAARALGVGEVIRPRARHAFTFETEVDRDAEPGASEAGSTAGAVAPLPATEFLDHSATDESERPAASPAVAPHLRARAGTGLTRQERGTSDSRTPVRAAYRAAESSTRSGTDLPDHRDRPRPAALADAQDTTSSGRAPAPREAPSATRMADRSYPPDASSPPRALEARERVTAMAPSKRASRPFAPARRETGSRASRPAAGSGTVHVSIDRIELRAVTPERSTAVAPRSVHSPTVPATLLRPGTTLDEYLRRRDAGSHR